MTRALYEYQVSSEGGGRHWEVPCANLKDTTPTLHDPACVNAPVAEAGGLLTLMFSLTGTVLTLDAADSVAVIDFDSMVYRHEVRTVTSYSEGPVEATWAQINVGDIVYYDDESDGLNGVKLSLAAIRADGVTLNPIFGHIVLDQDETADDFPKGAADPQAGETHICAIRQKGF